MPPFTYRLTDCKELTDIQLDTIRKTGNLDIHESTKEGHTWVEYYNYRVVDGVEFVDEWMHFWFKCRFIGGRGGGRMIEPIPIRCPVCGLPLSQEYEEHCTCSESDWRSPS